MAMSIRLRVTTVAFAAIAKIGAALPETARTGKRATAPNSVRRLMPVREEAIADVPCTWFGESPGAVIVYLHGGSYSHQAIGLQWNWAAALARETGVSGLFVDYALSGEEAYPFAVDQALAVIAVLRTRGFPHVVVAGDSAGGGLAVAVAERLRDAGAGADALVLVSPWLDVTLADPAAQAMDKKDIMLSTAGLRKEGLAYAGSTDPRDPGVSPLYGSAAGLPPSILHVGDAEMFLPDDTNWAGAVVAAGGEIDLHVVHGGFHVSTILVGIPEGRRALTEQVAFLRRILKPTSERSR